MFVGDAVDELRAGHLWIEFLGKHSTNKIQPTANQIDGAAVLAKAVTLGYAIQDGLQVDWTHAADWLANYQWELFPSDLLEATVSFKACVAHARGKKRCVT